MGCGSGKENKGEAYDVGDTESTMHKKLDKMGVERATRQRSGSGGRPAKEPSEAQARIALDTREQKAARACRQYELLQLLEAEAAAAPPTAKHAAMVKPSPEVTSATAGKPSESEAAGEDAPDPEPEDQPTKNPAQVLSWLCELDLAAGTAELVAVS